MEWGGEFIVKRVTIDGFAIGPLRKVQEKNERKSWFREVNYGHPISLKSYKNQWFFNDFHVCKCMAF